MTKNTRNIFLLSVLQILLIVNLYPQADDIKFEHLTTADGLSHDKVKSIAQDRRGFMWFGTEYGLNKYDGYTFKAFTHNPEDSLSLSSSNIQALVVDKTNTLWIGTWGGGLNRFDAEIETFIRYTAESGNPNSLSSNNIKTIYEDHSGSLWIGTQDGLNCFDPNTQTFTIYKADENNPNSLSDNRVQSICQDKYGFLWIGTLDGLNKLNLNTKSFTRYLYNPVNFDIPGQRAVHSAFVDRQGTIWVGRALAGLNKFDDKEEILLTHIHRRGNTDGVGNSVVSTIYEDRSGNLWVGTFGNGLYKFDRKQDRFIHYQHHSGMSSSLSDNWVIAIFEDNAGNLWIGTQNGINKILISKKKFETCRHNTENSNSLAQGEVRSICEDSFGDLWIGTWGGGVSRWNREQNIFTTYRFRKAKNNPRGIATDWVNKVFAERSGAIWVATNAAGGLNRFDPKTETFTRYRHDPGDPNSLGYNAVFSIYEDRQGTIWFGTNGAGLDELNKENMTFRHYPHNPLDTTSLSNNVVYSIHEDRSGILWIGTEGGLNQFDRQKKYFIHYQHDEQNPNSLSSNVVFTVYEDSAERLWIGTNNGLNQFHQDSGVFTVIDKKDGLPDNFIYGILEDGHGNLWLCSEKGISKFNPITGAIKNYDVHDGLQGNGFYINSGCKSRSGEMFFGGANGFTGFHPDSIRDNPNIPPLVITDFKIGYKPVPIGQDSPLKKSITESDTITISYENNDFSFEFAALDYTAPVKNKYSYMLEGFDKDWIYSGYRHFASYTHIPPGEYTFRVKGSNNDSLWNEKDASVRIIITPPWWETWWAYTLYGLFLFTLIYFARNYELRRQRLKHELEVEHLKAEQLAELDRMKSRFFANISHEFRTPITLILGPLERLLSQIEKPRWRHTLLLMQRNGQRLLHLINQLLDLSSLEAGKMALHAAPLDLERVLRPLVMAFESLAGLREIDLRFVHPAEPVTLYLDRDKFEKIMTNLLSNAFKFTDRGGSVEVVVDILHIPHIPPGPPSKGGEKLVSPFEGGLRGMLEIRIKDTGVGIPSDQLPHIFDRFYQVHTPSERDHIGSGIGLALTKELVELHHGKITVESEVGKGTTFIIQLPLGKKHLQPEEIADSTISDLGSRISDLKNRNELSQELTESLHPQSEIRDPKSKKSEIVLIVEDNVDMRDYMRGHLVNNYRIVEAEDGVQGFKKAAKEMPDLIISDVMMPNMSGIELCAKLKTDERTSHIPVILLTARAGDESKLEGLETGADDYLTKPFNARELQIRIKNLIEQRERLRQRFQKKILIQPSEVTATSMDARFLEQAIAFVETHIEDSGLDINRFSREMALSRSQLNRKLKALTGQSANEFIRCLRLKRAAQLLKYHSGTVSEIAYQVGFNNPAYFAERFRKLFGVSPSQYVSQ